MALFMNFMVVTLCYSGMIQESHRLVLDSHAAYNTSP